MSSRIMRRCAASVAAVALSLAACGADNPIEPREVASLAIDPAGPLVSFGEILQLAAIARASSGSVVSAQVSWAGLDPQVLTVSPTGSATARANGSARVVATASGITDTAVVVVEQRVAEVRVQFSAIALELPGDTMSVTGTPFDARGNLVAGAGPITWSASGGIDVDANGVVTATAFGVGQLTGSSGGGSSTADVEVIGDRFFLSVDTKLRYELDLPDDSGGPFPAVVWVHGSGMLDRNAQRLGTDPMVPEGLAAFRYDKRGVGESGGTFENVGPTNSFRTLNVLAEDAAAAARFVARFSQIDPDRIGMIGNSQGGWIVPQAALKAPQVVGYVMFWSGPTVSVGLENFYSSLTADPNTTLDEAYDRLSEFDGTPGYDALEDISSLDIPGLWLFGEMDRSIPMRLDVVRLNELAGQGKPFEVVTFEFGDHSLVDTRTGQFFNVWAEYLRFLRDRGFLAP
ncbi:MAG: prolyl oligopeptidase family serine peptidase [Gemmatimonadota bacterium]